MIQFGQAQSQQDLRQILDLQSRNLLQHLDEKERNEQGFLTVVHDLALLEAMNSPHPHTIARAADKVVGYALSMLRSFGTAIPVLVPMFELLDKMEYRGKKLRDINYVVMGQVCVDKAYRGQGVFAGLYQQMKKNLSPHFDVVVTEIATRNARSLRAHAKVGFVPLQSYQTDAEEWQVVIWEWHRP